MRFPEIKPQILGPTLRLLGSGRGTVLLAVCPYVTNTDTFVVLIFNQLQPIQDVVLSGYNLMGGGNTVGSFSG